MDITLRDIAGTLYSVEVGEWWCVKDLRKAASEATGTSYECIVLERHGEMYGAEQDDTLLGGLLGCGDEVSITCDPKQLALRRLSAAHLEVSSQGAKEAAIAGDTEQVLNYIAAGITPEFLGDIAFNHLRLETALAIAKVNPKLFGFVAYNNIVASGNYDLACALQSNGISLRFVPEDCADWRLFYDLCSSHSFIFQLEYLLDDDQADRIEYMLLKSSKGLATRHLCAALLRGLSTPHVMLKFPIETSRHLCINQFVKGAARHLDLDDKLAEVIRNAIRHGWVQGAPVSIAEAVETCGTEVVAALVEAGGDPNVGLLHCGSVAMARKLIRDCKADVNYNAHHSTPLQRACEVECLSLVKYLIEQGADVNQTAPCTGRSALIVASRCATPDIVKYLIEECSANHLHRTLAGFNAVSAAAAEGHIEVVKYLLKECPPDPTPYPQDVNLLHINAKVGKRIIHRELKKLTGKSLLEVDSLGRDVLMFAGMSSSKVPDELVEDCRQYTSFLTRRCKNGTTALGYAVQGGNEGYITALLGAGWNPSAPISFKSKATVFDVWKNKPTCANQKKHSKCPTEGRPGISRFTEALEKSTHAAFPLIRWTKPKDMLNDMLSFVERNGRMSRSLIHLVVLQNSTYVQVASWDIRRRLLTACDFYSVKVNYTTITVRVTPAEAREVFQDLVTLCCTKAVKQLLNAQPHLMELLPDTILPDPSTLHLNVRAVKNLWSELRPHTNPSEYLSNVSAHYARKGNVYAADFYKKLSTRQK
eukprot:TRINITY_DN6564_c1_g3_i1.p1 TRINITY_DN6564_c1_g3~~TRINITY_DN6564_c1_g3_i1.p1  ORF type:complete len:762 (+),score=129.87 TRINITY_DN6564_c1_g3_i1:44-2329(+)